MALYLRDSIVLPCMAMAHEHNSSSTASDMSSMTVEPTPRCTPTAIYPTARYNLRNSFKSLHTVATIIVGSPTNKCHAQTTYKIHRDLLTSASPFFAAALNGTFAEGLDQTVRLPADKPEIFEWFIWWLYTGSLTSPSSPTCLHEQQWSSVTGFALHPPSHNTHSLSPPVNHNDGDLRNAHGSPKYFLLLDLYALSDKFLTSSLSNHILDTMSRLSENTNSVPTPSDTWILYDSIRDTAPMRRLVLDLFAYKKTDKLLESHKDEWHPRFLRELVVKLKRPGFESLDRHSLAPWRPSSWPNTKGCECCRELLKPNVAGEKCEVCDRAFCAPCVRNGRTPVVGGEVGACKPWLKGLCVRYHDHVEGVESVVFGRV